MVSGTVYKSIPAYKYQGTVYKQDTRVYKFSQDYKGILTIPVVKETLYQGVVVSPAVDTREFKNIYKYGVSIKYKNK